MSTPEPLRKALLSEVESFLKDNQMAPTTFGLKAVNDAKFVTSLRAGLDPRSTTIDEVRAFMRDWRPGRPSQRAFARSAHA